jgi:hypothetical protein
MNHQEPQGNADPLGNDPKTGEEARPIEAPPPEPTQEVDEAETDLLTLLSSGSGCVLSTLRYSFGWICGTIVVMPFIYGVIMEIICTPRHGAGEGSGILIGITWVLSPLFGAVSTAIGRLLWRWLPWIGAEQRENPPHPFILSMAGGALIAALAVAGDPCL